MKNKCSIEKKQKYVPMIIVGESFAGKIKKKSIIKYVLNTEQKKK